jgi:hypothetical protein
LYKTTKENELARRVSIVLQQSAKQKRQELPKTAMKDIAS